ncbi:MAG: acyltransferase [Ruminococcus sp.]|nr:acyltransferase [Ruminococcus sp.]
MVYTDLLFFLCVLPFSVLLSFLDRSTEYKNLILILTSLLVFSWGKPFAVCLLFLTTAAEWIIARWIEKNKENGVKTSVPLIVDAIINLIVFFAFTSKFLYINEDAFGFLKALSSVGVMFYVLRGFSYVYDVYKGKIKAEKNIFCLLTYMCAYFFMPVGPVVRYGDMEPSIRKRSLTATSMNEGLNNFIYGLGKSVIIAPVLRKIGDAGLNLEDIIGCWTGAVCMLGFAYFLFAGFCDMSWGLAKIYGFDFKKNYRNLGVCGVYEGVIKSCGISLYEFFEEIIADLPQKYRKIMIIILSALTAIMFNQSLLFLLIGFIVGLVIIFEKTNLKEKLITMPTWIKFIYTYLISFVLFGGLFCDGFKNWGKWFVGLFGISNKYTLSVSVKYAMLNNIFVVIIAVLMILAPLKNKLIQKTERYAEKSVDNYGKLSIIKTILTALLLIACIIVITSANIQI